MVNLAPDDLHGNLAAFVQYRHQYLSGDEKGEAQVFCDRLFKALGHEGLHEAGATLEMRIKKRDSKGTAFADLMWKPRCLIEMKKVGTDLTRHYRQAFDYWVAAVPDRPRYVILCNFDEFWVYDFDQQLDEPVDKVLIDQLPDRSDALAFMLPAPAEPVFGNDLVKVTREAAGQVAQLFRSMFERGIQRKQAQQFTLQSVMAMFAEDIGLLPSKVFTRALEDSKTGSEAYDLLFGLYREMNMPGRTPGGRFKGTPYFNGGLFAEISPVELNTDELELLRKAASTNWSDVRPEIFGTLFEGSMDEGERHAEGAHFTSQAEIAQVVNPTIVDPWRSRLYSAGSIAELEQAMADMASYRVLDPACGSGNFLYVAYREMRRLENEARQLIRERRRVADEQASFSYVTPDHFYGIDRNPFAVEVAKVTMMLAKKLAADELGEQQSVLPLDNLNQTIVADDALFCPWPKADAIIGNPPYIARRDMAGELGAGYTQELARAYPNIGGVSDFVCYWFPKAHDHLPPGGRAGYVATATIRENDSRKVSLDYVEDNGGIITEAVSSQPWLGDAVVHVSIVNWIKPAPGQEVPGPRILWLNNADLRLELDHIPTSLSPKVDVRKAKSLDINRHPMSCSQGQTPGVTNGYVIDLETRNQFLKKDTKLASVIHPYLGGTEMLHDLEIDRFVIDLPDGDLADAKFNGSVAFDHLEKHVLPERTAKVAKEKRKNEEELAKNPRFKPVTQHQNFMSRWWQLWRRRSELMEAIAKRDRYIATSRVATFNRATVFELVDSSVHPGDSMTVIALDDDYSFGIVSSKVHREWIEARCSTFKGDPRYTSTTVWESFPWPQTPTQAQVLRIVDVVELLIEHRVSFLERGVSLADQYDVLRKPGKSKLRDLHSELDEAVMEAYGFSATDDLRAQILAMNLDLAADQEIVRGPGPSGFDDTRRTNYRLKFPVDYRI
ncbi:DNA methyltransferase [Rhodococcus aetherivorans]|uniref:DNA methyltransferase n=1 Tax=Rhodococcus aetherivorans TaxID=191292 RepID=UPI0029497C44|nr:DNA methyltransferase [Rhodococcus aetherivorans]MDV6295228.1 type IIL restriction-modification enzyme MmeI [Rhodococcus aetherivorans]